LYDTETHHHVDCDYVLKVPVPITNSHIHGITNERSASGDSFKVAFSKFKEALQQCDLVIAHNLSFDLNMLMVETVRMKERWELKVPSYCTMLTTVKLCGLYKWPKLSELHYQCFKTQANHLHNSMVDVIVCLRCYLMIMNHQDVCTYIPEWGQMFLCE
jgi:DNA polymerase-3 subunit epsilon